RHPRGRARPGRVTPAVTAAVLIAAVTHAGWNAIAHRITDKLVGFALISGGGLLIGLALLPFVPVPAAGAWPYLLGSAALHIAYYALRSEEHTSELQSRENLVCRLLLEKKNKYDT